MNPIVHGEIAWLVAQGLPSRRDRLLVTFAGLAPDLDSVTLLGGADVFAQYHHKVGHGFFAALLVLLFVHRRAVAKWPTVCWAAIAFHLHVLCDLVGDGPHWGIFYWWPLSDAEWHWDGAWDFVSWQNMLIGGTATLACLACAVVLKRTIVEVVSERWDTEVTRTLRHRLRRGN